MRLPIKILFAATLLGAVAVVLWQSKGPVAPKPSYKDPTPNSPPISAALRALPASAPSAPTPTVNLRAQLRESRNYAEFVRRLARAAAAGDPIAEYLTARVLKYCNDAASLRFRNPSGSLRTRNELEVRTGKYPVGLQQEILDSYDRCREFFTDASQADATSAWESWLDKASMAGYPPAQSLKADVSRQAELMRDAANASSGDIVPPTAGPARDLALQPLARLFSVKSSVAG
jgi:hypothetical protein